MNTNARIGILGAGQLGKMLLQAGSRWDLNLYVIDKAPDFPAAKISNNYCKGDFTKYNDVYQFGKQMDIITIEIENVNTEALYQLQKEGKVIYPQPLVIDTIKDKGLQKEFYKEHAIPTSEYRLFNDASEILNEITQGKLKLPFVQKARTEGYDGRGVQIVRRDSDLEKLFDRPSVIESLVPIKNELAVLTARNPSGDIVVYPSVEMAFHPTANLVEQLISPARVSESIENQAQLLAKRVIKELNMVGLLAIEFFLTEDDQLLVNEAAPRPHNSGHHTIEANVTSQYEQHLRAILDLPLGDPSLNTPAIMINLLGEKGHTGPVYYDGFEECLAISNVYIHLYGKKETKPFRKMGHVTVLDPDVNAGVAKARQVADILKVISK